MRSGFSKRIHPQCSFFAPSAHSSPQHLLTLHAYYHVLLRMLISGRVVEKIKKISSSFTKAVYEPQK
jgi:hypothetical protein